MNLKKSLENHIQGWLPKKPHSSSYQRITNQKSLRIRRQIGILAFIMGLAGGLLGPFGVSLGLFSGLGAYVWPLLIGIGLAIVAAVIVIRKKNNKEQKSIAKRWNHESQEALEESDSRLAS